MLERWIVEICRLFRMDMDTARTLLAAAAAVLVVSVLVWLFGALALSAMARYRWLRGRWMAWLPVFNVILLGRIHDRYMDEVKKIPSVRRVSLPVVGGVATLCAAAAGYFWLFWQQSVEIPPMFEMIVLVAGLCALVMLIVFLVLLYFTCYNICYSCVPDDALVLTIAMVVIPVLIPFVLFILRKKVNGLPPSRFHISK